MQKLITRLKRNLPKLITIVTEALDLVEEELNATNTIKTNTYKSGNKIIIDVNVPGISKDDINMDFKKSNFSISIPTNKLSNK